MSEWSAAMAAMLDPVALLAPVRDPAGNLADLVYDQANQEAADYLGRSLEDLVGQSVHEVLPGAAADAVLRLCAAVADGGEPVTLREQPLASGRWSGAVRLFDLRAWPAAGLVGVTWRDVTDRHALAAERALLRSTLDSELEPHITMTAVRDDSGEIVDFVYIDANPVALAYLGVTAEDFHGARLRDMYPSMAATAMVELYARTVNTGEPLVVDDYAYPNELFGGEERRYDLRGARLGDGLSLSWRDVTDRQAAAAAVAASEARYRLLAENAADVIMRFDLADEAVWVSPSAQRLLGYEPSALLGRVRMDLLHPFDLPRVRAAMTALRSGQSLAVTEEVRLRNRAGIYTWWQATGRRTGDDPAAADVVLALRNIDAEVQARGQANIERERRSAVVQSMLDPHLMLRAVRGRAGEVLDFIIEDANDAACASFERAFERLVGSRLGEEASGFAAAGLHNAFVEVVETGRPLVLDDASYRSPPGPEFWIDLRAIRLGDESISVTWRDVTDRHAAAAALAESEARYRLLADNAGDIVVEVDRTGLLTYVSPAVTSLLGWEPDQLVGTMLMDLVHPEDVPAVTAVQAQSRRSPDRVGRAHARLRSTDGGFRWIGGVVREVRDPQGHFVTAVAVLRDIHADVEAQQALAQQARTDVLTGLLNRAEMIARLQTMLAHPPRTGHRLALLFVDLDGLKLVNDARGHIAGDLLLSTTAARIRATVRDGDLVARIGGDELLVLLVGVRDIDDATRVAQAIRGVISQPIASDDGATITSTASIGVTLAHRDEDVDALIARADAAMYSAKQSGRDQVTTLL